MQTSTIGRRPLFPWTGVRSINPERFGENHVYSLNEIVRVARSSPEMAFFVLGVTQCKFSPFAPNKGFEDASLSQLAERTMGRTQADNHYVTYAQCYPVLLRSLHNPLPWIVVLASVRIDSLPDHGRIFTQAYYTAAEGNEPFRKFGDVLKTWTDSTQYQRHKNSNTSTLLLGNAATTNYLRLVEELDKDRISGSITVADLSPIPLQNLRPLVRSQDRLVQTDVTALPKNFGKFELLFGDLILSCINPARTNAFFHSVARLMGPTSTLFMRLACNHVFEQNGIEALPFAWYEYLGYQGIYFEGTLPFYQESARRNGLNLEIIAKEVTHGAEECEYFAVVTLASNSK